MSLLGAAAVGAAVGAGATLAGGGIGGAIGRLRERRNQAKIDATLSGQAQKQAEREAAQRRITKDFGLSDAKKRQVAQQATEQGRADIRGRRQALKRVAAASGGFGRSGALMEAEKGLGQQSMALAAKGGRIAADVSQKQADFEQKMDDAVLQAGLVREESRMAALDKARLRGQQRGAKVGKAVGSAASSYLTGGAESALSA